MLEIVTTGRFKRDLKTVIKRGCNIEHLNEVVDKLADGEKLADKYHDHPLSGDYAGVRECHIEPDWLLIYKIERDILVLTLTRTGTHSDLF